jgi:hypothetical protein
MEGLFNGASMVAYRFFILDRTNHFRGAEVIEAPHDEAACAQAKALHEELGVPGFELWQGARPVTRCTAAPLGIATRA